MNDPQRPFFADGRWNLYYLYNADYPEGEGTEWFHATSEDLIHWTNRGVAIHKYENGLGDVQSGSVVVDVENTAGFGRGTVVALATQQDAGVQRQSLFWSADGGMTFTGYRGNPVMDNPGAENWRDPKVVWDAARSQWVMALAEGSKIGFYSSPDLIRWTYRSGFVSDELALLECPDLFQMSVDADPGETTWVLGTSANGSSSGRTTGYVYWTGDWDGVTFEPDEPDPQWLDEGPDFYAGVTWTDPRAAAPTQLAQRYALGWVNNWAYADDLPTRTWHGGAQSLVRIIRLESRDGGPPQLRSWPVSGLDADSVIVDERDDLALPRGGSAQIATPSAVARRIQVTLDQAQAAGGALDIRIGGDGSAVDVHVDVDAAAVSVVRAGDLAAPALPASYRDTATAPFSWTDGAVTFDIIVDGLTLEVFTDAGDPPLTSLVFPDGNDVSVVNRGPDLVVEGIDVHDLY